jgi:heptosyltransferase-2
VHAFDHLRVALHAGGIATPTPHPVLYPGPEHQARAALLMQQHELSADRYALLMPGCKAGGELKRWGARRYIALAINLHNNGLERVVLIGSADDQDVCRRIAAECGDWLVNLCGATTILDLVPLCAQARCIVSNDTGTAHVAAAGDRPLVVICGPTDPRRVKPIGDKVTTLQADIFCINCYRKDCAHHSCMALISPERVFETLHNARVFATGET